MMRFSVLASGSRGNALYVETAHTRILVDAGLSCRELIRRLDLIAVPHESLDALIITHEHIDHVKGAGTLARRLELPVYINTPTLKNAMRVLGNLPRPFTIHTGQAITIKDILIETFTKCHDAIDPIGLVVSSHGVRVGMITDIGRSTTLVTDRLRGCDALIIEFNHDHRMLEDGPYPWEVKRRIRGPDGHLSNQQAAALLRDLAHEDLGMVVLAHLSEVNNDPQMAVQEAQDALASCGLGRTKIFVGHQDDPISITYP